MSYIAEILSDDVVWVLDQDRQLVSMHLSLDEANYYCLKHLQVEPRVVDRRPRFVARHDDRGGDATG